MFVYLITNTKSGRQYVGKANSPSFRYAEHWRAALIDLQSGPLYDAMRSDGREAFTFEILQKCETESQAYEQEKVWIERLQTTVACGGFNRNGGGGGGNIRRPKNQAPDARTVEVSPELIALLFDADLHARTDLAVLSYSRSANTKVNYA